MSEGFEFEDPDVVKVWVAMPVSRVLLTEFDDDTWAAISAEVAGQFGFKARETLDKLRKELRS